MSAVCSECCCWRSTNCWTSAVNTQSNSWMLSYQQLLDKSSDLSTPTLTNTTNIHTEHQLMTQTLTLTTFAVYILVDSLAEYPNSFVPAFLTLCLLGCAGIDWELHCCRSYSTTCLLLCVPMVLSWQKLQAFICFHLLAVSFRCHFLVHASVVRLTLSCQ